MFTDKTLQNVSLNNSDFHILLNHIFVFFRLESLLELYEGIKSFSTFSSKQKCLSNFELPFPQISTFHFFSNIFCSEFYLISWH